MRFAIQLIYICMLLITISSCSEPEGRKQLRMAEDIIESNKDSASSVLSKIDISRLESKQDSALYYLLVTKLTIKNYDLVKSYGDINYSVDEFESSQDDARLMEALFYRAFAKYDNLKEMNGLSPIIEDILKSTEIAKDRKDLYWQAKNEEFLGDIYDDNYNFESASELYRRASTLYKESGKQRYHRFALWNYARAISNIGRHESAKQILDSLYKVSSKNESDSLLQVECLKSLIYVNFWLNKYTESIDCFKNLKKLGEIARIDTQDYTFLSKSLFAIGKIKESQAAADSAYDLATSDLELSKVAYPMLDISEKQGDYKMALEYSKLISNVIDSIASVSHSNTPAHLEKIYYNNEKDRQEYRAKAYRVVGIATACILIAIIGLTIYKIIQKNRLIKINLQNTRMIDDDLVKVREDLNKALILKSDQVDALQCLLTKKDFELESEKEARNKSEMNNALLQQKIEKYKAESFMFDSFIGKYAGFVNAIILRQLKLNEIESDIKIHIEALSISKNPENRKKENGIIKNLQIKRTQLYNEVDNIYAEIKSDNLLSSAEEIINIIYPGELALLKDSARIKTDVCNVLILSLIGFAPKSISFILKVPEKTIYTRRSRLREKIESATMPSKDKWMVKLQ